MALKESLKLIKPEARHEVIAGTKEQLNKTVSEWLVDGWVILEARMTMFDRYNNIIEAFYILQRIQKDD